MEDPLPLYKQNATVKWFDEITGHGLITTDELKELIIHSSELDSGSLSTLHPGQAVIVQLETDSSLLARKVELRSADPGATPPETCELYYEGC